MSKISLKSSSSGTATFTIESPSTNTDRTLNLPDSAGTVATAESTLAQFNVTGSAPVFACRAFVNFNGTGTVAIRASGNVSSVTDRDVGKYTVNLTNAMPDANYSIAVAVVRISGNSTGEIGVSRDVTINTTRFGIDHSSSTGNPVDSAFIFAQVFR